MSTATQENQTAEFGRQLQQQTAAVRLRRSSMGTLRKLTADQVQRQAATFGADPAFLQAKKRLINIRNEHFRTVQRIMAEAGAYWKEVTVPFPDRGLRLIRRDRIDEFEGQMSEFQQRLTAAIDQFREAYTTELIPQARESLGSLFDPADYPAPESLDDQWDILWEYPSVEPPDFLRNLNPQLWEQERQRAAARFNEAVAMAEAAFQDELQKLVGNLVERLTPQEVHVYSYAGSSKVELQAKLAAAELECREYREQYDGDRDGLSDGEAKTIEQELQIRVAEIEHLRDRLNLAEAETIERRGERLRITFPSDSDMKKISRRFKDADELREWLAERDCETRRTFTEHKSFQASSLQNLQGFFERFQQLNIGSNEELDQLVQQAQTALEGKDVNAIRQASDEQRDEVRRNLAEIASTLETMETIDRPTRMITLEDDE